MSSSYQLFSIRDVLSKYAVFCNTLTLWKQTDGICTTNTQWHSEKV